jgi:hypothetical protein
MSFKLGDIVYHKATENRGVVIAINEKNNKLSIRDQTMEEYECFDYELYSEDEFAKKYVNFGVN